MHLLDPPYVAATVQYIVVRLIPRCKSYRESQHKPLVLREQKLEDLLSSFCIEDI